MDIPRLPEKVTYENVLDEVIFPKLYLPIQRLDEFLESNRHLLTLIGVFGAVSVYLGSAGENVSGFSGSPEFVNNFATFASLGLLTLLSLMVLIKVIVEIYRTGLWEGFGLLVFAAFFGPLILVITGLLTTFPRLWAIYFLMASWVIGMAVGGAIAIVPVATGGKLDEWITGGRPIISFIGNIFILWALSSLILSLGDPTYPSTETITQGLSLTQWWVLLRNVTIAFAGLFSFVFFGMYILFYSIGLLKHISRMFSSAHERILGS